MPERYRRWNEALAEEFFPVGHSGTVYLDPNDATLTELAAEVGAKGDSATAFVEAVKETLWVENHLHLLYRHNQWFAEWWSARDDTLPPPMIGLLALFVYASTKMVDDRGYYQPLANLLGIQNSDSFRDGYNRRVRHLWAALNRWIERTGRGTPTAYPQDIRANVSLLLTQRFLSTAERAMLPGFFARTRLVPGVPLTIPEMEDHIRRHVHLLPEELKGEWRRHADRFAEVAHIEFEIWTGEARSHDGDDEDVSDEAALLLGLYFDRRDTNVAFPLAVTSSAVPAGAYFFEGGRDDSPLVASAVEELCGSVTFDGGSGERFAVGPRLSPKALAALLDERVTLSNSSGFRLEREASEINLFLPLSPGTYIEAPGRRLPLGSRFSLLVSQEVSRDQGLAAITSAAEPDTRGGCPPGWVLYRDLELRAVPTIPAESPLAMKLGQLLPTAQEAVIDLRDGIAVAGPTRAGRAWLACDPPKIVIAGALDGVEVQLHVHPASGSEGTTETLVADSRGFLQRPAEAGALLPGAHYLYVTRGGATITRQKLQLVTSDTPRVSARQLAHTFRPSAFGLISARPAALSRPVQGALWGDLTPTEPEPPAIQLPALLHGLEAPDEHEDADTLTLGRGRDTRPDRYRRSRRRRAKLTPIPGMAPSLESRYHDEIAEAVGAGEESFTAQDGTRWRVRYDRERNAVFVGPQTEFVPCGWFTVSYD